MPRHSASNLVGNVKRLFLCDDGHADTVTRLFITGEIGKHTFDMRSCNLGIPHTSGACGPEPVLNRFILVFVHKMHKVFGQIVTFPTFNRPPGAYNRSYQ